MCWGWVKVFALGKGNIEVYAWLFPIRYNESTQNCILKIIKCIVPSKYVIQNIKTSLHMNSEGFWDILDYVEIIKFTDRFLL